MANELTHCLTAQYSDSNSTQESLAFGQQTNNVASHLYARYTMFVGTTDTVIPLVGLTLLGYSFFLNRDSTSSITIYLKTQAGGTRFATLLPGTTPGSTPSAGGYAWLSFGPDITAPVAIASSSVEMEVWLFNGN